MINQEEYEVLKELDDKYKWIARDGFKSKLNVYNVRPTRSNFINWWLTNKWFGRSKTILPYFFPFIQWTDSEPYFIPDLIKEYEDRGDIGYTSEGYAEHLSKFNEKLLTESEEEMKKDKKWLKEELVQSYLKESEVYLDGKEFQKARYFEISEKKLFNLIDQLDEPEKVAVPKFVAEWLTEARDDSLYGLLERVNHLITTDYKWREWWEKKVKGETFSEVQSIIAKAVINGYEVEKDPKYYVELFKGEDTAYLKKDRYLNSYFISNVVNIGQYQSKFTEQEIKDYDERFWAFAVPVEELE